MTENILLLAQSRNSEHRLEDQGAVCT